MEEGRKGRVENGRREMGVDKLHEQLRYQFFLSNHALSSLNTFKGDYTS